MRRWIGVFIALLTACSSPAATPAPPATATTEPGGARIPVITLERQPGIQHAHDYTLTIWSDGSVIINDRHSTTYTTSLPMPQLLNLVTEFQKARFMELNAAYLTAQEAPYGTYATLAFTQDGTTKTVQHYSDDLSAPEALARLEYAIEAAVDPYALIGTIDPEDRPADPDAAAPLIELQRGSCTEGCPVYHLAIWPHGKVEFTGLKHVDAMGVNTSSITPQQVQELILAFKRAEFMQLDDAYTAQTNSDAAETSTAFTNDGQTKLIRHNHSDASAPQALSDLEELVDLFANTQQWIGNGGQ